MHLAVWSTRTSVKRRACLQTVSRITATDAILSAIFSADWRMGRRNPYDSIQGGAVLRGGMS